MCPVIPEMAELYLNFVIERHKIWEKRQNGLPAPWTDDPVLRKRKFTNTFRVLDHGSQFLLKMMHDLEDPEERVFLAFLYRYINRPEPFEYFVNRINDLPRRGYIGHLLPACLEDYRAQGRPVFGNAYKMFVGNENKGWGRLEWVLSHTWTYMGPDSDYPRRILAEKDPAKRNAILQEIPRCRGFMSMQIQTDIAYVDETQDENDFVIAGPGAKRGASIVAPRRDPLEVFEWAQLMLLEHPEEPLLAGDGLTLMDIQNTFCEFSKYHRWWSQPERLANFPDYTPAHPGAQPAPILPKHW